MKIKNVTIAGAGVMGSQISWQTAFNGFTVKVYDPFEKGLENGKQLHQNYAKKFVEEGRGTQEEVNAALGRIAYTTNIEEAFANADLISESVPEDVKIKKEFWHNVSRIAREDAILTSNSSSFVPSNWVDEIKGPDRFLAMHFFSIVWEKPLTEVMAHGGTNKESFNTVVDFVGKIGLSPVPINVEYPGYVINSLFIPWLFAALKLHFLDIVNYKMVDKVWMVQNMSKTVMGPFAQMDEAGLNVVYHVTKNAAATDPELAIVAEQLKEQYLDKGKTGVNSGEGFYKYPNPEFENPSFFA
ncbi:MAG: hypothetical protein KA524_01835 [Nitrosomonas sp.]|nr:hypothetical protein [Nitrosomonas sp.]MBP6074950.1 hypothetical protein [Nitrosomonas sp.]